MTIAQEAKKQEARVRTFGSLHIAIAEWREEGSAVILLYLSPFVLINERVKEERVACLYSLSGGMKKKKKQRKNKYVRHDAFHRLTRAWYIGQLGIRNSGKPSVGCVRSGEDLPNHLSSQGERRKQC
jgi:hypothetical protein